MISHIKTDNVAKLRMTKFLILLYYQFQYEKCNYLALTGGGRRVGMGLWGGALPSVNN